MLGVKQPIDKRRLELVVSRISRFWNIERGFASQGTSPVVVVRSFNDLPQQIVHHARDIGYDNSGDDRIMGVTHKGQVYLVHENISSEIEAEEALFHEHIHLVLRSQSKDTLVESMNRLYDQLGGGEGLLKIAKQVGFDMKPYRKQASTLSIKARVCVYMEEFLAHAEGARAYKRFGSEPLRRVMEFWGGMRHYLRSRGYNELSKKVGIALNDFNRSDVAYILKGLRQGDPYGLTLDISKVHSRAPAYPSVAQPMRPAMVH